MKGLTQSLLATHKLKRCLSLAKIVLDLHDIFNKGYTIDAELNRVIAEAVEKKIALVEIIPGKGSGQLKKESYDS